MVNGIPIFTTSELTEDSYRELLPDFFKELNADFDSIRVAQKQNKLQYIRQVAHKIKGSAACYSACLISEKARLTQVSIDSDNQTELIFLINQLEDSITQSQEYARQNFNI